MAAQYGHLQFFRRMPNAYLARYFKSKAISLGMDFNELKENDADAILQSFLKLPEEQQAVVEADFQDINALAFDGGVKALVDEAAYHDEDDSFAQAISEIESFHAKVMWAFLGYKCYWRGASMFIHADSVSPSYWKKRNQLPPAIPCVEDEDIDALEKAISDFFHTKEGKGRNCKVEPYRRHNKEYFFAYPEDFAQSDVEWVSDTLKTRARHPAFEIIFVYCEEEHSLDIYAPKNTKAVPTLQKLFAQTILKLDTLPSGEIDNRVYDLTPLNDSSFEFNKTIESGIVGVVVTRLRLSLKHGVKRRIVLEADTKNNPQAVYELLDELNLPEHHITQISLKVMFEPTVDNPRGKTRRFNITHPNSCALNHSGNDAVIRDMLAQSGIEPALQPD